MRRLPQSPKKTVAGLKLYRRKPRRAAARGAVARASGTLCWSSAAIRVVRVAKNPTPAARPSTPSMRLKALVQPTSHRMVAGRVHQRSEEHTSELQSLRHL